LAEGIASDSSTRKQTRERNIPQMVACHVEKLTQMLDDQAFEATAEDIAEWFDLGTDMALYEWSSIENEDERDEAFRAIEEVSNRLFDALLPWLRDRPRRETAPPTVN
jgi:hypothetical protein